MDEVDVWLLSFAADPETDPVEGLVRVFKIDEAKAKDLLGHLPRVVKRRVKMPVGQRFVAALESIGGKAVMRPSRTSSQPPRPSTPPNAGPAYSLPPMSMRPDEFAEVGGALSSPAANLADPRKGASDSEPPRGSFADSPAEMAFSDPNAMRGGDFIPAVSVSVDHARVARHSSPPPGPGSSRPPAKLPSIPPIDDDHPLLRAAPSVMLIVSGLLLVGAPLFFGHSVFLGTALLFNYLTDGLAITMVGLGVVQLFRVFALDDDAAPSFRAAVIALIPCVALSAGIDIALSENDALAPRGAEDVNARLHQEFQEGRALDEVLGDQSVVFPGYDHDDVHQLVNDVEELALRPRFCEPVEVEGAPTVRCIIVELTDSAESRAQLSEAYRRFLGMRAHRVEDSELTAPSTQQYMRLSTAWEGR